jgi:hypothetical protein
MGSAAFSRERFTLNVFREAFAANPIGAHSFQ